MAQRVLLVDDDSNLLAGLRRNFRKEPFEVLSALSAQEALVELRKTEIDVVVSDNDMPGMTGVELLKKVHEEFPDTVRFMLTGNATLDVAIEAINEGAISRFFTKPCNPVDLAVTVQQAIRYRQLLAAARSLLEENRQQRSLLSWLEDHHPGITQVAHDDDGAIVIEDMPDDIDEYVRKMNEELAETIEGEPK